MNYFNRLSTYSCSTSLFKRFYLDILINKLDNRARVLFYSDNNFVSRLLRTEIWIKDVCHFILLFRQVWKNVIWKRCIPRKWVTLIVDGNPDRGGRCWNDTSLNPHRWSCRCCRRPHRRHVIRQHPRNDRESVIGFGTCPCKENEFN